MDAPPYVHRPPIAGLLGARAHEEDFLVPLGIDEQSYAFLPTDFALVFKQKAEPERMAEALEQALALFPPCAGRFVEQELVATQSRTPVLSNAAASRLCICILCNNAGAGWNALEFDQAVPSSLGPMGNTFFDFATDTAPGADGKLGGPLFRAKLSSFIDGQILGLSFAQGLSDCRGISIFLRTWSSLYRGEDPGPPPMLDRLHLDDLFRRVEPGRVKPDFALLNKSRCEIPRLAPEKNVVAFSCTADEVQAMIQDIHNERKSRHLSLDRAGKNLEAFDVGCGAILHGFGESVPVNMWVNYRTDFEVPQHFGNARGEIAFDTPPGYEDASEMVRRREFSAHRVEFWGWQRTQGTKTKTHGVTLFPLVMDLALEDVCFHAGDFPCFGLPLCLWEEQMKSPGYIAVLPEPSGGCHVEALVPRAAAAEVANRFPCQLFPIR